MKLTPNQKDFAVISATLVAFPFIGAALIWWTIVVFSVLSVLFPGAK